MILPLRKADLKERNSGVFDAFLFENVDYCISPLLSLQSSILLGFIQETDYTITILPGRTLCWYNILCRLINWLVADDAVFYDIIDSF